MLQLNTLRQHSHSLNKDENNWVKSHTDYTDEVVKPGRKPQITHKETADPDLGSLHFNKVEMENPKGKEFDSSDIE